MRYSFRMRHGNLPEAPNYTNAALAMGFVNLLWVFMVLWVLFGLPVVLGVGWAPNLLIGRLANRA